MLCLLATNHASSLLVGLLTVAFFAAFGSAVILICILLTKLGEWWVRRGFFVPQPPKMTLTTWCLLTLVTSVSFLIIVFVTDPNG